MKCEFTVIIYDGVARIGSTLKSYDDIGFLISVILPLPSSPQFAPTTAVTITQFLLVSFSIIRNGMFSACNTQRHVIPVCVHFLMFITSWNYTLISTLTPSRSLCASRTGCTTLAINASVCSLARPVYLDGSMDF